MHLPDSPTSQNYSYKSSHASQTSISLSSCLDTSKQYILQNDKPEILHISIVLSVFIFKLGSTPTYYTLIIFSARIVKIWGTQKSCYPFTDLGSSKQLIPTLPGICTAIITSHLTTALPTSIADTEQQWRADRIPKNGKSTSVPVQEIEKLQPLSNLLCDLHRSNH